MKSSLSEGVDVSILEKSMQKKYNQSIAGKIDMEAEQTSSIHSELSEASDNLELHNPMNEKLTRVGLSLEELIKFE